MDAAAEKVLTELSAIQQIAQRPRQQNPLLDALLSQAQALAEIGAWATNAQRAIRDAQQLPGDTKDDGRVVDMKGGRRA